MKLLTVSSIESQLRNAVTQKKPFSMVRLGDGEYELIKLPIRKNLNKCRARIARWFKLDNLSIIHFESIRNVVFRACQNADMLGVPSIGEQAKYFKWRGFTKFCTVHNITPNKNLFYFYDINKVNFQRVLNGVQKITCISCRDISEKIKIKFSIPEVNTWIIPGERFCFSKALHPVDNLDCLHYPYLFTEYTNMIKKETKPGEVYLIGAGGLGKSYCNTVKQSGGIAIDIGSLFDAWAGVVTRPYMRKVKAL